MRDQKRAPERQCVVCRRRGNKGELVRLVWSSNAPIWDREQRMPGRGAYVHGLAQCFMGLVATKVIQRAFRLGKGGITPGCCSGVVRELSDAFADSLDRQLSQQKYSDKKLKFL